MKKARENRNVKTIGKHINNALKEELDNSVVANFATTTEIDAEIKSMWYRLSRREDDYCIECSEDGMQGMWCIEELASKKDYQENVSHLSCLLGVKIQTALSTLVEVGDFKRFASAQQFASYLGLTPGEDSSGEDQNRLGITKAGNSHIRTLLVEAAQSYTRGKPGYKSKALKARQKGNPADIIAYADKANERLRRRYYQLVLGQNKKANVAKTAVARELACFIWGMMTDNIH